MIYGCIGEQLPHSFSREIHEAIGGYAYELREIAPDRLDAFMAERSFRAVNVTIPYKQAVMAHLSWLSDTARAIGAVNTVVNREGLLYGYNTDFDGLSRLIRRLGLDLRGKNILILGTGGTSRTALYTARTLGAARIERVSRTARGGALTCEQALQRVDTDVIINTTPCGMFPHRDELPIALEGFPRLSGVIDAIYNPLRSRLVLSARSRGVPAEGGLYMLVAQAVRASEIFLGTRYPDGLTDEIYGKILRRKENIVLIGMPGSGKSTVARALGARLSRPVADLDDLAARKAGMSIPEFFARFGEAGFRDLESEVVASVADGSGQIIATGGGTILRGKNVEALRQNGRLFLLDRPLDELMPSADRPLGDTREKIERLYRQRTPLYRAAADEIVASSAIAEETAREIEGRWNR